MGILNVTPDSFSDGGEFLSTKQAVERGSELIADGADILDIGAESTRPGAAAVSAEIQTERVVPVIVAIRHENPTVVISVDTRLALVARAALGVGADMINDTSALRDDSEMCGVIADAGAAVVLMHRKGTPLTMQQDGGPMYADVLKEILDFLQERRDFAVAAGIPAAKILLDPGLGFGKRFEHNLSIMRHFDRFFELGQPMVLGASRKTFIGQITGVTAPNERDAGSLASAMHGMNFAHQYPSAVLILRVHEVKGTTQAVQVLKSLQSG
ncbi:MAG: dihydropteroate synthase [Planctomycetota bacterium]